MMSFLVGPLDELLRFVHIGAAILWVGLIHFMAYIRPRILDGLGEGTRKEVLPHIAARLVPWLSWSSLLTVLAGIILYLDEWVRHTLPGLPWTLHAGSLLGIVMVGLTHALILPGLRRVARLKEGAAPPPAGLHERTHQAAVVTAMVSWLVLALMVLASH